MLAFGGIKQRMRSLFARSALPPTAVALEENLSRPGIVDLMRAEFDVVFYADTYLRNGVSEGDRADPFRHYLRQGVRNAHSPNRWFQEDWYRAFYADVRAAIDDGRLTSGFHHYLLWGRSEERLPRYDLNRALEARMPGVTSPVLISRVAHLGRFLSGLDVLPKPSANGHPPGTIWFLLPTMNPDITFGGYRAAYELMAALSRCGYRLAILCLDDDLNKEYFIWREPSTEIKGMLSRIEVFDRVSIRRASISRGDLFVAYSVWGLRVAEQLASLCETKLPFLLAQEYEPVFYDSSALRVVCEEAYRIPHYPLISTRFLHSYFERRKIGVFNGRLPPREVVDYAVFEHRVSRLPAQTLRSMAARANRLLAVYARPEGHAARNLFEIVVLALQDVARRGLFDARWSFVGLGALSDLPPIALGGGHQLVLHQKMGEGGYHQLMSGLDLGISMMYAPHPGVMAFEFATTGALVITNVYENRTADELRAKCENILPCEPSVPSLARAIELALSRVDQFALREERIYRPPAESWEVVFSREFLSATFGAKLFG